LENAIAREIEGAAVKLATTSEELSSAAEEVTAASENISSTQQQLAKGSNEQVMAITETQRRFSDLSKGIRTVREKVINIGQVADLIKGIASQTNMLALNAAIEAARAGEAGRGFNVVADQVRKLADDSSKAVASTEEMLSEIDLISKQQEGAAIEILKSIDTIATIAEEASSGTEEAASAAEEQTSSMESITSTAQGIMEVVKALEYQLELQKNKGASDNNTGGNQYVSANQESKEQEKLEEALISGDSNEDSAF
ncbi:MAG: hypothetical protein GY870_15310, partial [archaeon]|nr:hypothetical protein [archaeon]